MSTIVVRSQARLAVLLASTAGFVDAYGLITYNTFISLMGGNTTRTGSEATAGNWLTAGHAAVAIVSFVGGIVLGTLLTYSKTQRSRRFAYLLAAILLGLNFAGTEFSLLNSWAGILTLSVAMGVVNTTLCHVGPEKVSLTFVTGMLNHIGTHLALAIKGDRPTDALDGRDSHLRRAVLLGTIWISFVAGAALSGWATPQFGAHTLLPPLAVMLLLAAFVKVPD